MFLPFACTKQPVWCCFLCCPVLSAVLWLLSARSLGPLPSQQHQTKRGLVAVRSLNSKLTSFLFLLFQKLLHLLVTKHRDLPGPVLAANTHLLEIKYTPTKSHVQTTGARGSAGPAHTTAATFLLKIFRFVVAGAVVMSGHSCTHEHRKLIFRRPADQ